MRRLLLVGVLAGVSVATAEASPRLVLEAVPNDAVAALMWPGQVSGQTPDGRRATPELTVLLSNQAYQLGLLSKVDPVTRGWIDTLVCLSEVLAYPHAVVLLDIGAEARDDGGHQLAGLHAAVIVQTKGANEVLERRIQYLLNVYTNTDETVLSRESRDGNVSFTIQDRRLPPWAGITWGPLGEYYVVAVGNGAYAQVARTIADRSRSLAGDHWFTRAMPLAHADDTSLVCHIHSDRLRRSVDVSLSDKIGQVMTAMKLRDVERGLWAFKRAGRAIEATGVVRRGGRDEILPIAGKQFLDAVGASIIPEQARGYAVIDWNPRAVLLSASGAYLAARSPESRERSQSFWRELEANARVSFERDVFSQLGPPVIIHDYPAHPLNVPFAWTILLRVEGDASMLREHVDRLLDTVRQQLAGESIVQLRRDTDGVWYVQLGLAGPALTVTDRWLVISYSPQAVRSNVMLLSPSKP